MAAPTPRDGRGQAPSRPASTSAVGRALDSVAAPLSSAAAAHLERATIAIATVDRDTANSRPLVGASLTRLLYGTTVAAIRGGDAFEVAAGLAGMETTPRGMAAACETLAIDTVTQVAGRGDPADLERSLQTILRTLDDAYAGPPVLPTPRFRGPDELGPLLHELSSFTGRDDMPALVQADTLARAMSGHRASAAALGRALAQAELHRRGVALTIAVPPRDPGTLPPVAGAHGAGLIAAEIAVWANRAAAQVARLMAEWHDLTSRWRALVEPRAGTATSRLLEKVAIHPVLDAATATSLTGGTAGSTYHALEQLEASAVLREVSGFRRNRIWCAPDLLALVDDCVSALQAEHTPTMSRPSVMDTPPR